VKKLNRIIESYPPELKLLLVFCGSERWEAEKLIPEVKWDIFLAWIKRHRVTPAVYRYIKKNQAVVPEEVAKTIEQRFEKITKRNLLLAGEVIQICNALENIGINAIPIKGVVLSWQLYGNLNERETRDIDILITPGNVNKVIPFLTKSGYSLYEIKHKKEFLENGKIALRDYPISLKNDTKNVIIELHWQLLPWKGLCSKLFNEMWDTKKHVLFQGAFIDSIDLLRHMEFNVYHGTKHFWSGLQWVMDIKYWQSTEIKPTDILAFENVNCYENSHTLIDLLFKKSDNKVSVSDKWLNIFVSSISTMDESVFKSLYYKLKNIRLAFWLNLKNRGFWKVYLKYFWLKLFC
jgi:hypothetical protein